MCKKPLKGFKYGKTENGKDNYYIRPYQVHHLEITPQGKVVNVYDSSVVRSNIPVFDYIEVPCGKCIECKLAYSRSWADRCMLEAQYHDKNCFLTLTYDPKYVPTGKRFDENGKEIPTVDPVTGEVKKFNTLRKKDLQDFLKRFRMYINRIPKQNPDEVQRYYRKGDDEFKEIRYLACGEYGKQGRPHYHLIIFGWYPEESDIVPVGKNDLGQVYYGSQTIAETWAVKDEDGKKHSLGFHVVAECEWNSCAYVARYVTKKLYPIESDFYEKCGMEKEFIVMSRRPGIGSQWFDEHNESYSTFLKTYLKSQNGSHSIGSIKYFDNKLANEFPKIYEDMKEKRVYFAKQTAALKKIQTTLPYLDYLQVENDNLEKKTKILKGGLI